MFCYMCWYIGSKLQLTVCLTLSAWAYIGLMLHFYVPVCSKCTYILDQSLNLTSNNHQGAINLVDRCSWWFQPFSPFCLWCANPQLASSTQLGQVMANSPENPGKGSAVWIEYHSLLTPEANANNVVFDAFSDSHQDNIKEVFHPRLLAAWCSSLNVLNFTALPVC